MSTEIRQELKIVPAQASVVKHVRYTYACRRCDREAVTTPVITAAMPVPVLPGSLVSPEERYRIRLKRGRPIVDEFKEWLDYQRPKVLPKSAFGQAIGYSLKQWQRLNAFFADGRLEIDNNRAERSIKPFVIGRKNWLLPILHAVLKPALRSTASLRQPKRMA